MKPHHFLAIFVLSLCLTTAFGRLKIASPTQVKSLFDKGIESQFTRFGVIPSGSSLTGTLILADPEEACTSLNNNLITKEQIPIFVTRNGGCKYVIKAMYAQLAGAKMMIIIDKSDDLPREPVGHDIGFDISIPTIIIRKSDGDKLVEAIKEASKAVKPADRAVIATMNFPYGQATTTVTFQYFFSSADTTDNAYQFIRDFKEFYLKSKNVFFFEPRYVTWYCAPCKDLEWNTKNEDCVSGGRYCAPDPDNEGPLKGSDVVMEDLRQICIWKNYPNVWWDYVDQFEKCIKKEKQNQCSQQTLKNVGFSSDKIASIERCMDQSFEKGGLTNKDLSPNTLLQHERQMQDDFDISMFPTLFINYQQYMGSLGDSTAVFRAACDSLQTPTPLCNEYFSDKVIVNTFDTSTVITFTIILLMIVIIILFFYRRMARREMTKEMSMQVSQMVSQYFALNDLNETQKKDEL